MSPKDTDQPDGERTENSVPGSPTQFCAQCKRPVSRGRAGSLTSWLFTPQYESICQCSTSTELPSSGLTLTATGTLALKLNNDAHPSQGWVSREEELALPELNERVASNFVFLKKLGEGGMGSVYLVKEKATGEQVAIKLVRKELLVDPRCIKRFEQEAMAVRNLVHPNLVSMREYEVPLHGSPYIVMDYVRGVDLATILHRHGALSCDEALDVFIQVTEAIAYAHAKGIIHRDLKPANIIVSLEGERRVKVVDFGIAKMLRASQKVSQVTEVDEVVGTPYYMSPEQCQGDPLDARSDIYSLGCVLYEALSGRPPFTYRHPVKVILAHLKETPRQLQTSAGKSRRLSGLEQITLKCLEKKREHRYKSAADLLEHLICLREGRNPVRLHIKRKHGALALGTLVAIILLAVFFSWPQAPNPTTARIPAVAPSTPEKSAASTAEKTAASTWADTTSTLDKVAASAPETTAPMKEQTERNGDDQHARSKKLLEEAPLVHASPADADGSQQALKVAAISTQPEERLTAEQIDDLVKQAQEGRSQKHHDIEEQLWKRALSAAKQRFGAKDEKVSHIYDGYTNCLISQHKLDEAMPAVNDWIQYWTGSKNSELANALSRKADVYHSAHQYDQAIDYLNKAIEAAESNHALIQKIHAYEDMAGVLRDLDAAKPGQGYNEKARKYLHDLIAIVEQPNFPGKTEGTLFRSWYFLGVLYNRDNKFNEAAEYFKKAAPFAHNVGWSETFFANQKSNEQHIRI